MLSCVGVGPGGWGAGSRERRDREAMAEPPKGMLVFSDP